MWGLLYFNAFFCLAIFCCSVLKKMYGLSLFFCYFLCFYIAPSFYHIEDNIFPFYSLSYESSVVEAGVLYTTLFLISVLIGVAASFFRRVSAENWSIEVFSVRESRGLVIVLFLASCFFIALLGPQKLMVLRGESMLKGGELVLIQFVRTVSFLTLFYCLVVFRSFNRISGLFMLFLCFSQYLVACYPVSLPRFVFFGHLIFLYIFFFREIKYAVGFLVGGIVAGVFTIFPVFSSLTRHDGELRFLPSDDYYRTSGDFDGFQSLLNVILFTQEHGYLYGRAMLSTIFGFVPRSIWASKAEPTGLVAAEALGYDFVNISAPITAEAYIDFGLLSLFVVGFLLGVSVAIADRYFKLIASFNYPLRFSFLVVVAFYSMEIVLLRGSLLAVINIFYSFVFVFFSVYVVYPFLKRVSFG